MGFFHWGLMFSKLAEIETKFEELSIELSKPEVLADQDRYKVIAKEHADLRELVEVYREYKNFAEQLKENRQLVEEENDAEIKAMAYDEIPQLEKKLQEIENKLKVLLLPKDPNDDKNTFLEIRAGTGGDEASLFAADLFRMYQRFAEEKKWQIEVMEQNLTGIGGLKELIALITGKGVYSYLKYESGTHRVQRVPKTETQGRVHTSAVTVAVLPEADDVDIEVNPADLRIDTYRASGAGGQHVNKTDSAVRITHEPSGVVVACQDERSQHKNKARAMKILRSKLYELEQQRQMDEQTATRRAQVGSGDRSEKIRTYNFPQNRLTDHRIGFTSHNLAGLLEGDLEGLITELRAYFQAQALKGNK